jgi:hypothetical protein
VKLAGLIVPLSGTLKIADDLLRSRRRKLEAGHPNHCSKERWRWKGNDNKNGKRVKRSSKKRFRQAKVLMASEAVLEGNGTLTSGRDTLGEMGKTEGVRVLVLGGGKLLVLGRRLRDDKGLGIGHFGMGKRMDRTRSTG